MAAGGERRMVFDVRGRRKHVIRVVYAILAVLMGSSLFFVVGPFNFGELLGGGGTTSAAKVLDEQAERAERRLAQDPANGALLLTVTRARINAGNARVEVDATTGERTITPEARLEYKQASRAWSRYLKRGDADASPAVAQLVANTYFSLAQEGTTYDEIDSNVRNAAAAQRLAAEARPNVGSLSTLAIFEYFSGDFRAGDRAAKQAAAEAPSKMAAMPVEKQLDDYRKRAKKYAKQRADYVKAERETGKESLENPLGGLAGGSSSLGP